MNTIATTALAARLVLAAVCLVAAAGKLAGRSRWRALVRSLADVGVPRPLTAPVGAALVGAELAVAGLAPWPDTAPAGTVLATALFAVLTVGVASAVRNGTTAPCRCFGTRGARLGRRHVARNAVLTALAAVAVLLGPGPVRHPAEMVLAIGTAAIATVLIVHWDDIATMVAAQPARK